MDSMGDRLRHARELAGLSLGQVAQYEGISKGQLADIEKGRSRAMAVTIAALAKRYECSADYLLGMVDTPQGRVPGVVGEGTERLLALWEATPAKSQEELLDVVLAYGSLTPEQQLLVDRLLKELVQLNTPKIIGDAE